MFGIIGAGRGCYEVADLLNTMGPVTELWDDLKLSGIDGKLKIPLTNKINPTLYYVISAGEPKIRKILYKKTRDEANFLRLAAGKNVHIGSRTQLGEGLIMQNNSIIACDARVGQHVFLNFTSNIGHDSSVGDFCFIGALVDMMGYSKIGEGVMLGCGALVLPDVEIGDWAVIGAGAVVTKNVPPHEVWVGNPARKLR